LVFSSTIFLFGFLPAVLGVYFLLPGVRARNAWLLFSSLFFYAFGEAGFVAVLLASILLNWALGVCVQRAGPAWRTRVLAVAVTGNLLLLGTFKYANFLVDNLAPLADLLGLPRPHLAPIHLPIGISFFTFQALTYVVDIHRGQAPAQRNPLRVALYISLFPQLIAGPIVRYQQIASQLAIRVSQRAQVAEGVRRFVVGLGKKVLLANPLAVPADAIFALPGDALHAGIAWLGIVCFGLQIYFDFSGYSDMAIGLGRIFGFRFPENFDYPYIARSMREFWRRWHMSLSTWFRDYVYIPLGGSRGSGAQTRGNLLLVFFLCGLWHGASWNFVVWGLFHGAFLALERTRFGSWLANRPPTLQHVYLVLVVLVAWVFFRVESLPQAWAFFQALAGLGTGSPLEHPVALHADAGVRLALALGVVGSTPWLRALSTRRLDLPVRALRFLALQGILLACAMALAAGTHNPFIYFRF
jgi:alginate O-acetyltransferase complex protein AlgI